jgi:hypothetical protein
MPRGEGGRAPARCLKMQPGPQSRQSQDVASMARVSEEFRFRHMIGVKWSKCRAKGERNDRHHQAAQSGLALQARCQPPTFQPFKETASDPFSLILNGGVSINRGLENH